MNTSAFGVEKATLIRVPATANLMVDSADRPTDVSGSIFQSNVFDFQITRSQPLINGYFTRIGTTEVVFEWCYPNINSTNNTATWIKSDTTLLDMSGYIPSGLYDVSQCLFQTAYYLNANTNQDLTWEVLEGGGQVIIQATDNNTADQIYMKPSPNSKLLGQLDLRGAGPSLPGGYYKAWQVVCPDLRPFRYIDIVCEQLTQVQDVKDSATNQTVRDVLCRWYFSEDTEESYDPLGFPILMGYRRFCRRRIYNPPKQIKWEQNVQVGNLRFVCYADGAGAPIVIDNFSDKGEATDATDGTQWLMTLQLTEG